MRWILFYPHFSWDMIGWKKKMSEWSDYFPTCQEPQMEPEAIPLLAESGFQDAISWLVNNIGEYYFSNKGQTEAEKLNTKK